MTARRRDAAKVGTLARSATQQAPHLTQPNNMSSLSRDRGDLGRWLRGLLGLRRYAQISEVRYSSSAGQRAFGSGLWAVEA